MSAATPALRHFLACALELEAEAGERYRELAVALEAHNNDDVAGFFLRMAAEAENHRQEVAELARGLELPELPAWEFDWPDDEPPETASYEAVHYRMTLREALELALANERAAGAYYAGVAARTSDEETARLAASFAAEEAEHEAALMAWLAELPATGGLHRIDDDDPVMPA